MKTVVLAEKPSVGKEIARVLGCKSGQNGYLENDKYIVTWALGHLVTLATPDEYDKSLKEWSLDTLPMIPEVFKTSVIKETSKQFSVVKTILKSDKVDKLVIATDAGREGELVARWIIEKCGFKKPLYRLWISSLTDDAIRKGMNNLYPGEKFYTLYESAKARAIADWLVGLNITRALTCKYNSSLSAGRVQTPTLAMIVDREEEINKFQPVKYNRIYFLNNKTKFIFQYKQDNRIFNLEETDKILNNLNGKKCFVDNVIKNNKSAQPQLLYDLTELQRDCNKLYNLTPKQTLDIVQKLYEHYKYLTYPRTDSRYLTSDMYNSIPSVLKSLDFGEYSKFIKNIINKPIINNKRIFNDKMVSDHYAIIPTGVKPNLNILTGTERNVFELVVKRFISVFMEDYQYQQIDVSLKCDNYYFKGKGQNILKLGWKEVYKNIVLDDVEEDNYPISNYQKGETVLIKKLEVEDLFTTPPSRYTLATLLTAMEHPGKFIDEKAMKDVIEKASGIGTPATRADIIDKLFKSNYVSLKGKSIYPESKGQQLIKLVPKSLKSPLLTAEWELRLENIYHGKEKLGKFISDITVFMKSLLNDVVSSEQKFIPDNLTKQKCPECGGLLLEVKNKFGTSLVCENRNCKYRKNLEKNSNARCPNCHKKLKIYGENEKKTYFCECGYREKVSVFHEKNKSSDDLNKYQLNNYLKNQKNEVPSNNPFLDAFNDFKK